MIKVILPTINYILGFEYDFGIFIFLGCFKQKNGGNTHEQ